MPFTAYLPSGFQHPHENELFAKLVQTLAAKFGGSPGAHVLIGNIIFEGHEMDAVFLKPDGVCIVEMKSHGGQVHFSENIEWFADTHQVRGGHHINPFQQVRTYRIALRNYLRSREAISLPPIARQAPPLHFPATRSKAGNRSPNPQKQTPTTRRRHSLATPALSGFLR